MHEYAACKTNIVQGADIVFRGCQGWVVAALGEQWIPVERSEHMCMAVPRVGRQCKGGRARHSSDATGACPVCSTEKLGDKDEKTAQPRAGAHAACCCKRVPATASAMTQSRKSSTCGSWAPAAE